MKEDAYKTYYELSALKDSFKKDQSMARKNNDKDLASECGEKAVVIDTCMKIVIKNFRLTFET